MNRIFPLLLLALTMTSCGKQGRRVELEGNSYYFPAHHISGIVEPKDSGSGQYYIRLTPGGGYFWLVYAPWKESRRNPQGRDVPTIAHI